MRRWCSVYSPDSKANAVGECEGPLGPFFSSSFFSFAWLRQLPSWLGAGSPRHELQCCSWGHSSSLLSCVRLGISPRFSLSFQCTHRSSPCMEPHRSHPSSCCCMACFTLTSRLLRVFAVFITVLTPSGWHIFLIRSLIWRRGDEGLGGVSFSMVVLDGVGLPLRLFLTTGSG